MRPLLVTLLAMLCLQPAMALAQRGYFDETPRDPPKVRFDRSKPYVDTIFLRFKVNDMDNPKPMTREQSARVSKAAGVTLRFKEVGGGDQQVLLLPRNMYEREAKAIVERIERLQEIQHADYNRGDPLGLDLIPNERSVASGGHS